jgi:hypothetical protein
MNWRRLSIPQMYRRGHHEASSHGALNSAKLVRPPGVEGFMHPHTVKAFFALSILCVGFSPTFGAAAAADDEARFLAAVRNAFHDRKASDLSRLTCWDGVPEEDKKKDEQAYAALVAEKDVSFNFELVDRDRKVVERTEHGVVYRTNLPITRQLDVIIRDKQKKTLGVIGFPAGRKNGKLMVAGFTPVK